MNDADKSPGFGGASVPRSGEVYAALFEHSHAVMLLIDPASGRIVDANQAAVEFYGWSREQLTRKSVDEINALPREEVERILTSVNRNGKHHFLSRHRCADGGLREVEIHSGRFTAAGRDLLCSIVQDVTERVSRDHRLLQSENLQRIAGRLAHIGGWAVDLAARTVYWSDEVCKIHGLPVGTTVSVDDGINYYAPEYRKEIAAAFEACARDGTPYDMELEIQRADGRRLWVRTIGEPMRDDSGKILGVHGAFQDISEQRRASERLQQLWTAVEQSPESIIITDLTPKVVYVNDAAVRISGYSRTELLGQNPRILASGKTPDKAYALMWTELSQGRAWTGVFHNRRKSGDEYVESACIAPVRQRDGRVTHYLAIKADITQQRKNELELARYRDHLERLVEERTRQLADAREQAEAASQAKSSFLARMSHEIRTPMNGILGSIEIMEQKPLRPEQQDLVATIRESGRALLHVIDDILDFSRIEAGRMELAHHEFSLQDMVESLCDSMINYALDRDVDLYCFVAPKLPGLIVGDELRLRQVLANLVGNAIKFSGGRSGQRGCVTVRLIPGGDKELRIEVEDNGIGISEEAQKRLFQPFAQSEESTTRRFGGSGLGLVISKRLVEMMHGEIGLYSTPGEGSLFWARVPLEAGSAAPNPAGRDLSGLKVGLEPHELLPADIFEHYLWAAGATVTRRTTDIDVLVAVADPAPPGGRDSAPVTAGLVLLDRESRRKPERVEPGVVRLSLVATQRRSLLEAVAQAAGLQAAPASAGPVAPPALAGKSEILDAATAAARGELILVAEDDPINQTVLLRQLELLGRVAEVASDGAQALELWHTGRFALVLTDLHMPNMDGYSLVRAIREAEAAEGVRPTPIVALTANAVRGESERAAELGFDDYVTKPVTIERLREALERWLPSAGSASPLEPDGPLQRWSDAKVLDLSVLGRLLGGRAELMEELLQDFLRSAAGLVEDMVRACRVNDAAQLAAVTHRLKSSARSVGALELGEVCEKLEQLAKSGPVDFNSDPCKVIRERLEAVQRAAAQRRGSHASR